MKGWLALTYFILFSLTTQTIFANFSQDFFDKTLPNLEKTAERPEGSQEEKQFFEEVIKFLTENHIIYQSMNLGDLTGAHSFSQGISVTVPGMKPDIMVIVYPVNPSRPGHLNQWVPGVMLEYLKKNTIPPLTLKFLFLGAERGEESRYPMGSRLFLESFYPSSPKAALYLNLDGSPGPLELVTESGAYLSPIWLFERAQNALFSSGIKFELLGSQPPLFRFDLPEKRTMAQLYFQENIPTVMIQRSESPGTESPAVWGQKFYQFLEDFVNRNAQGLPVTWDRHYLYFQLGIFSFLMNQQTYLILFIGLFAILTGWALLTRKRWIPNLSVVWRFFWQIPVLFIFLFLFLFLSTLILQGLQTQRQFENLWTYQPLTFLLLKMGVAVTLFIGTFFISKRIPFVRWAGFYTTASVVILSILLFAALITEISFSFYFLWALVFTLAFALVRNRILKLVFLFLAPFWFLKTAFELFLLRPDNWLNRQFLTSPWDGNLMVSAALFPFLLLVLAFHFFKHHRAEKNEGIMAFLSTLGWGLGTLGVMIFVMNFNPFNQGRLIPLEITQTMDYTKNRGEVELKAPVPWKGFQLKIGGSTWTTSDNRKYFLTSTPPAPDLLKKEIHQAPFLNRINYQLQWTWKGSPRNIKLTLDSPKTITIYDCNFPFSVAPDGKTAEIFIGVNPPSPLNLELTLARDQEANLDLFLTYLQHPQEFKIEPGEFAPSLHLSLHDFINLVPVDLES